MENCSIGLIAGPASSPRPSSSSSSAPLAGSCAPPTPTGVRFGPGDRAPQVFIRRIPCETRASCGEAPPLGEVSRITFHTPAATPTRKDPIRKAGLRAEARVEHPADPRPHDDGGDGLAARPQAKRRSQIRPPSGLPLPPGLRRRRRRRPTFHSLDRRSRRARNAAGFADFRCPKSLFHASLWSGMIASGSGAIRATRSGGLTGAGA